ncbi:hypothetical protein T265_04316 [Opisthorchis viverrini]|uniref:Integrase catalytic domain-containing protein n=1 Tax=Opisthorchis viverrini TaxID=6198 RepID=A0A075AGP5_OPIVI|nr:hypothetical protein T265_04316 [Opisthorchis viverrini]KER28929.1 hypothetical protein T265_04316 [Opisthorchis viverrini]
MDYVLSCKRCQLMKGDTTGATHPMEKIPVLETGELWSVDIMGPFPVTTSGNQYIVIMTEHRSWWIEAEAVLIHWATTISGVVMHHIVANHGVPKIILTDQWPCFVGEEFTESHVVRPGNGLPTIQEEMCQEMEITHMPHEHFAEENADSGLLTRDWLLKPARPLDLSQFWNNRLLQETKIFYETGEQIDSNQRNLQVVMYFALPLLPVLTLFLALANAVHEVKIDVCHSDFLCSPPHKARFSHQLIVYFVLTSIRATLTWLAVLTRYIPLNHTGVEQQPYLNGPALSPKMNLTGSGEMDQTPGFVTKLPAILTVEASLRLSIGWFIAWIMIDRFGILNRLTLAHPDSETITYFRRIENMFRKMVHGICTPTDPRSARHFADNDEQPHCVALAEEHHLNLFHQTSCQDRIDRVVFFKQGQRDEVRNDAACCCGYEERGVNFNEQQKTWKITDTVELLAHVLNASAASSRMSQKETIKSVFQLFIITAFMISVSLALCLPQLWAYQLVPVPEGTEKVASKIWILRNRAYRPKLVLPTGNYEEIQDSSSASDDTCSNISERNVTEICDQISNRNTVILAAESKPHTAYLPCVPSDEEETSQNISPLPTSHTLSDAVIHGNRKVPRYLLSPRRTRSYRSNPSPYPSPMAARMAGFKFTREHNSLHIPTNQSAFIEPCNSTVLLTYSPRSRHPCRPRPRTAVHQLPHNTPVMSSKRWSANRSPPPLPPPPRHFPSMIGDSSIYSTPHESPKSVRGYQYTYSTLHGPQNLRPAISTLTYWFRVYGCKFYPSDVGSHGCSAGVTVIVESV